MSNLKQLIALSRFIGKNTAYAQGGGGNTSIKVDSSRMIIKASGGLLKDMSETDGYSVVDYQTVRGLLENLNITEDEFAKKIADSVVETTKRPSIETGFHALLGQVVIHTHSVYANLITCSKQGKELIKKLFPQALWIEYATPGKELIFQIKKTIDNKSASILFLQNHGLLVSADTVEESQGLHEQINQTICHYFSIPFKNLPVQTELIDLEYMKQFVLFPDQVVYTLGGNELLQTTAAQETICAYQFILSQMQELNLTPSFISQDKVVILQNLESEKYRQNQISK